MRVSILDYGVGNLHSLEKALDAAGQISVPVDVRVEDDPARASGADVLVLPGVGAFGAAATRLRDARSMLRDAIRHGLPTLGICLGMQLLFEESEEGGEAAANGGLGVLPGRVTRMRTTRLPHIGWNAVEPGDDPLFCRAPMLGYFANSYVCRPRDESVVIAWSEHDGDRFPAAVRAGNMVGMQFHPEKSSAHGLRLLGRFLRESADA